MSPPNGVPPGTDTHYLPVPAAANDAPSTPGAGSPEPSPESRLQDVPKMDPADEAADEKLDILPEKAGLLNAQTYISDDDALDETEVIVPPDGGWGWVVVAASFMCNMIVDGIIFSFGSFIPVLTKEMNASEPKVSLVGSLMSGFYLIAGPFVSALANRFGFSLVAIAGSIVSAIAFALSYFAPNVEYLFVSFGILGGKFLFGSIFIEVLTLLGSFPELGEFTLQIPSSREISLRYP